MWQIQVLLFGAFGIFIFTNIFHPWVWNLWIQRPDCLYALLPKWYFYAINFLIAPKYVLLGYTSVNSYNQIGSSLLFLHTLLAFLLNMFKMELFIFLPMPFLYQSSPGNGRTISPLLNSKMWALIFSHLKNT